MVEYTLDPNGTTIGQWVLDDTTHHGSLSDNNDDTGLIAGDAEDGVIDQLTLTTTTIASNVTTVKVR